MNYIIFQIQQLHIELWQLLIKYREWIRRLLTTERYYADGNRRRITFEEELKTLLDTPIAALLSAERSFAAADDVNLPSDDFETELDNVAADFRPPSRHSKADAKLFVALNSMAVSYVPLARRFYGHRINNV